MRQRIVLSVATLVALSVSIPAFADGLTGSQVTLTLADPTLSSPITLPITATVGPGVEFPTGSVVSNSPTFSAYNPNIDISADSILLDYTISGSFNGASFNGFIFDFSGAPAITGVSLDPLSTLTASQVGLGFTGDQITVNLQGDNVTPDTSVLLDVDVAPAATPEPRSFVLLTTGLLAIAAFVHRKKITA